VCDSLLKAGFSEVEIKNLWETRKIHDGFDPLARDLRQRTGRSILHDLTDAEVETLISHVESHVGQLRKIVEKDRWTLWIASKT